MTRNGCSILAGIVMIALLPGCTSMDERLSLRKPTARLTAVKFADVNLQSATLLFDVAIENHYPVDLPLLGFSYRMSSRGLAFLSGSSELRMTVPAGGTKTVALPAKIDYLRALKALAGALPGSTIPYEAQLGLKVNTPRLGPITLAMSQVGELTLPAGPNASMDDVLGAVRPR